MDWDDLRYVLAAARSGSFLGASKLLKVSQATVGRRIKALETDLGSTLFRRYREGCEPTEAALRILPLAEQVESKMRDLGRLVEGVSEPASGLVEVHTATWLLRRLLVPALPAFYADYPKVQLHLVGDVVEQPSIGAVPVISVRFSVMPGPGDIETKIADLNYSVFAPRGKDPDALPWATTYGGQVALSTYTWFLDQNIEPDRVFLLADDADLIAAAISTGEFKGLIPDIIGESLPGIDRLTNGDPDLVRTMRAIVGRHVANRAEVQAVLTWIEETISSAALRQ